MNEKQEPRLVEVTLAKPHTHAGVDYAAGARIKVDESTAKWLADNQVTTTTTTATASEPKEGKK